MGLRLEVSGRLGFLGREQGCPVSFDTKFSSNGAKSNRLRGAIFKGSWRLQVRPFGVSVRCFASFSPAQAAWRAAPSILGS